MPSSIILPSTPQVSAPAAPAARSASPAKPGAFAAVLSEEKANLEPASKTEATESAEAEPETDDAVDSKEETANAAAVVPQETGATAPAAVAKLVETEIEVAMPGTAVAPTTTIDGEVPVTASVAVSGTGESVPDASEMGAAAPAPTAAKPDTPTPLVDAEPVAKPAAAEVSMPKTAEPAAPKALAQAAAAPAQASAPVVEETMAEGAQPKVPGNSSGTSTFAASAQAATGQSSEAPASEPKGQTPQAGHGARRAVASPAAEVTGAGAAVDEPTTADAVSATGEAFKATLGSDSVKSAAASFAQAVRPAPAAEAPTVQAAPAVEAASHAAAPAAAAEARVETTPVAGVEKSAPAAAMPHEGPNDVAVRSVRYLVANGEKQVTVRLQPEALGELTVSISIDGDGVDVRLTATRPAAGQVLEHHVNGLREALAREGIDVTRLTVTTDLNGGGFQHAGGRQTGSEAASSKTGPMPTPAAYRGAPAATGAPPRAARHSGSLDLYA